MQSVGHLQYISNRTAKWVYHYLIANTTIERPDAARAAYRAGYVVSQGLAPWIKNYESQMARLKAVKLNDDDTEQEK